MVAYFNKVTVDLYDHYAPIRCGVSKRRQAPWLTLNIRLLIRERNNKRRAFKRTGYTFLYAQYKELRRRVKFLIVKAREEYYLSTFNDVREPKRVWSTLRHLGLIKSATSEPPNVPASELNM